VGHRKIGAEIDDPGTQAHKQIEPGPAGFRGVLRQVELTHTSLLEGQSNQWVSNQFLFFSASAQPASVSDYCHTDY
jgi:hypothetical protein